jgi:glycosyltransferase involved in cell wall biosynthesis
VNKRPTLSIVIPAYNEAARLPGTLAVLRERFGGHGAEVVVVDDGSTDGTASAAEVAAAAELPVSVIRLPENRGKGAAVRAGIAACRGDAILCMDADLATDLAGVEHFLARLDDADVVVGSRALPGSRVHNTSVLRTVMGRTFNGLVRLLTRLEIRDSQCGFKAFRAERARLLFALSEVDGFAYDPEVLLIARILGLRVVEVPVEWTAVEGSSVRPIRDSLVTGLALLRIVWRLRPSRVWAAARARGWDPSVSGAPR